MGVVNTAHRPLLCTSRLKGLVRALLHVFRSLRNFERNHSSGGPMEGALLGP